MSFLGVWLAVRLMRGAPSAFNIPTGISPWNPTLFAKYAKGWGTLGLWSVTARDSLLSALRTGRNLVTADVLVIFLLEKLRPRLWAISRSSRKYHDFSK